MLVLISVSLQHIQHCEQLLLVPILQTCLDLDGRLTLTYLYTVGGLLPYLLPSTGSLSCLHVKFDIQHYVLEVISSKFIGQTLLQNELESRIWLWLVLRGRD
jgi:hypothetical protein